MKIFIAITLVAAFILVGCSSQKKKTATTTPSHPINNVKADVVPTGKTYPMLEFSKSPCFGKCPVYSITVMSDGNMEYFGKMNVDKLGKYQKQLTKDELSRLYSELNSMDLFQYDDMYGAGVMDVPMTKFVYREDGNEKTIKCKMNIPEPLTGLMVRMDKIAMTNKGWTLLEALPKKGQPVDRSDVNEVIVYVVKDFDLKKWALGYSDYDLNVMKSLSPNGLIWLLDFDKTKISGSEMLQLLRKDADIQKADLNMKVDQR